MEFSFQPAAEMKISFQPTAAMKNIKFDDMARPPIIHLSLSARPPGWIFIDTVNRMFPSNTYIFKGIEIGENFMGITQSRPLLRSCSRAR
jgi:hypothetical protein